jgi:hypothetical protein
VGENRDHLAAAARLVVTDLNVDEAGVTAPSGERVRLVVGPTVTGHAASVWALDLTG